MSCEYRYDPHCRHDLTLTKAEPGAKNLRRCQPSIERCRPARSRSRSQSVTSNRWLFIRVKSGPSEVTFGESDLLGFQRSAHDLFIVADEDVLVGESGMRPTDSVSPSAATELRFGGVNQFGSTQLLETSG